MMVGIVFDLAFDADWRQNEDETTDPASKIASGAASPAVASLHPFDGSFFPLAQREPPSLCLQETRWHRQDAVV